MSKQTNKKETRKENGSAVCVANGLPQTQTGSKKSFSKSKCSNEQTNKASTSIDSPEEWPTLGETVNVKEQRSDKSVQNGDINNSESKSSKKKSPKKIGQLNEQSSSEAQSNGSTSGGDQEDDDSSTNKDDAQSSSSSERPTTDEEKNSTPAVNGRKKKSRHKWVPLVIETVPSGKHYDRKRGSRSRRRDNSVNDYDNISRDDTESRGGYYDKSYKGPRRNGRGRGGDNYDRGSFKSRPRSFNGTRGPHDDYPAEIHYYYDPDPITPDSTAVPVVHPAINGNSVSPTLAQAAPAAFIIPTQAMPTAAAYIAPYFTTFTAPVPQSPESLRSSIRNQVEYYFCEENLQKDFFLRRKMDSEGYLPVSLIASFQRVKLLTEDMDVLIDSMLESEEIDLSEDRTKVRTKNDPHKWPIFDVRYNESAN